MTTINANLDQHDQHGQHDQVDRVDQLDHLDHVAIVVKDIDETVAWYQKQFKCSIKYQDKTWALLGFGNIDLAFVVKDQHPHHIALKRKDAAQFGTLKTHRDGTKSVYIHDPSGNNIEVMADQD